jgi:acetylornithine deacetylase/succinyl-diaminopimelate desuccinylase-like protein
MIKGVIIVSMLFDKVNPDRIAADTLELVKILSPTGDTREIAKRYEQMLIEVGCTVVRYEFIPNNPTLVATYGNGSELGKTILFNGHMDVVTLEHEKPYIKDGFVHGRGACDMKGSLACIIEVLRVFNECAFDLPGKLIIIANSLHESPGGRGEDLIALIEHVEIHADMAVVMEGASIDCTVTQLGSTTFEISIQREGEASHQLYTPLGTPHPITIAAEIISKLNEMNVELEKEYIEDIGYASYFIGSVHSGQFYNQHPNQAEIVGVRRYNPQVSYEEVENELRGELNRIAERNHVHIELILKKVRDGYYIDKNNPSVLALVQAIRKVRNIDPPLLGRKLVTDACFFVNGLGIPTLCHGPNQRSAHGDKEFVEIHELDLTVKVYLQLICEFMSIQ